MDNAEFHALRDYLESDVSQPPFAVIRSRRLRRTRVLAMTGAAVAVIAVTVWSVAAPRHTAINPPIGNSPTGQPTPTASVRDSEFPFESSAAFPADVVLLDPAAPSLPTDRAVGNASFVFAQAQPPVNYLVTRDGRQYRIDPAMGESSIISPDGRWLTLRKDGVISVRDLTGTTYRATEIVFERWWSGDGRYHLGTDQSGYAVLDTQTWTMRPVGAGTDLFPFGVLDTGQVLVPDGTPAADRIPMRIVNAPGGSTATRYTVIGSGRLRAGESLIKSGGEWGVDLVDVRVAGEYGVVRIHRDTLQPPSSDFLVFSTADGRIVRRIDVPSRLSTGWYLTGTLVTVIDHVSAPSDQLRTEFVVAIDLRDGHVATVSRIHAPGDIGYLFPGLHQPD